MTHLQVYKIDRLQAATPIAAGVIIIACCALPAASFASDDPLELTADTGISDDDLMISDVDLEERESVFVATKTRKTMQEAPAIVTVLTGKEMDEAGFRTLNEALHTVPGFEHSNTSRWDFLFTRGNAFTVSVLVNGVPIVNPGDNLVFLDQAYPINIIDRVEIISGPGGILWGANAYLGVINIVTKKGEDIGGFFVEGGGGSFNTGRAALAYGDKIDDVDVMVFANFQTTNEGSVDVRRNTIGLPDGFAFPPDDVDPSNPTVYNTDGDPTILTAGETAPNNDFFIDAIGQVKWQGFTVFGKVSWERDYYQVSSSSGARLGEEQSFDTDPSRFVSVAYDRRVLNDAIGLHSKVFLWSQEFQVDSIVYPAEETPLPNFFGVQLTIDQQFRYGANFEIDAKLPWGNTLLAGAEVFREEIKGAGLAFFGPNSGEIIDGGELVPDSRSHVVSVYINDELNLFERVAVSGGLRFNYSDTYASALLGSANIVGHILDYDRFKSYIKLSYTQGFRPPSFEQRFSTTPFFLGNQEIGPERSEAFQVELNAKMLQNYGPFEYVNFRVDFAHTNLNDLIALQNIVVTGADGSPEDSAQFDNIGTRRIDSVESAGEAIFKRGHRLWFAYSYNQVRDVTADVDVRNHAPHIVNAGGRYRFNRYISFNVRYSWVASKTIENYFNPDSLSPQALDISDYHLLSAGLVLNDAEEKYRILLHGYNLLGQQYETVDGDTVAAPYPYPQPNALAFLARLQASF